MSAVSPVAPVSRLRKLDARLVIALAAVWVLWGSTYLGMRIAVVALPPFLMAGARFVLAGSALLVIERLRGQPLPIRRTWLMALPTGFLLFVCGNGFVMMAVQRLPSSVAAVVCATTPLIASGIWAIRGERPRAIEVLGMLLGAGGVALLGVGSLGNAGWRGFIVLLAPIGWASGSLLARAESAREPGASRGLAGAAANMIAGGVWMLLLGTGLGEHLGAHIPWQATVAWVYLVVFGSLMGFTAYSWLLANSRPAVAMSYAYVNPIVAVLLGAALGGETLGWTTLGATALIASGVMASVVLGRPSQSARR